MASAENFGTDVAVAAQSRSAIRKSVGTEVYGDAPVAVVGDLVNHRGKWITLAPTHCPHGHPLGPGQVLVGHVACQGHGIGQTLWHCVACPVEEPPTYGPPLGSHCSVLHGPAAVRVTYR